MSLGALVNLEQATVQALAEPMAEARADVQELLTADLDATGGRAGRPRAGLWTAVTAGVTVLVVRRSRPSQGAHALWGERCWGALVPDRWSAYSW